MDLHQGLPDGSMSLNSTSKRLDSVSKLGKRIVASDVAANMNPSASLDLSGLENAMASMEKIVLQNVYHEKMLLYRDHQVALNEGSTVSENSFLSICYLFLLCQASQKRPILNHKLRLT